ncbi:unnamed protein product [Closterium sp. NIES-54]
MPVLGAISARQHRGEFFPFCFWVGWMECRPVCVRDVQRTGHDVRGRRCWFWVRYRHDNTEEVVPLRKICRRPETEYRVKAAEQVAKAVGGGEGKKASVKQSKGN